MREKTFIYKHHIFKALNDLRSVTYYTSPVDYIVVQYGGGWMPYNEFRKIKAFNHLPEIDMENWVEEEL